MNRSARGRSRASARAPSAAACSARRCSRTCASVAAPAARASWLPRKPPPSGPGADESSGSWRSRGAPRRRREDQDVGDGTAVVDRPEGTGPSDARLPLVDDERDGPFGREGAQTPYDGVRDGAHLGRAPGRFQEHPGGPGPSGTAVVGDPAVGGDRPVPAGRGADQCGRRVERVRPARAAEPHARVVGESGRQSAQQLGDEGVLHRGGEVHDLQRGTRIEDPADRLQHGGVVVSQRRTRPRGAVQVAAAVGALDGEPPRPDRHDRKGTRVGARGGFTRRAVPRSALALPNGAPPREHPASGRPLRSRHGLSTSRCPAGMRGAGSFPGPGDRVRTSGPHRYNRGPFTGLRPALGSLPGGGLRPPVRRRGAAARTVGGSGPGQRAVSEPLPFRRNSLTAG